MGSVWNEMKEISLSSKQAGPDPMTFAAKRAIWKQIWSPQLPPKLAVFLWRLLQDKLPTNTKLKKIIPAANDLCKFCGEPEISVHLFFHCPRAIQVWFLSPFMLRFSDLRGGSPLDCWREVLSFLQNFSAILTQIYCCWFFSYAICGKQGMISFVEICPLTFIRSSPLPC